MSGRALSLIEQRIEWTSGFRCETDKTVLKALARWYAWRADGANVRPRSITELSQKSGVPLRSVERALRRLVDGEWLEVTTYGDRGGPSTYRIVLDQLATADPETLILAPSFNRHSGGKAGELTATVAVNGEDNRHSGGKTETLGDENRPIFEEVAANAPDQYNTYPGKEKDVRGTHTPGADAPAPFRHPNHAYCGACFCVPQFLEDEFAQQSGWTPAQLMDLYRTWNARAMGERHKIANALKWLRARFAEAVRAHAAATAPQQMSLGPMVGAPLSRREIEDAHTIRNRVYGGCPHAERCGSEAACVREIALARRVATS